MTTATSQAITVPTKWRRSPLARTGRGAGWIAAAAGIGLAVTLALTVQSETLGALSAPGGVLTALGRVTGMVGAYLLLVLVVVVGRLPALERAVGQDRLVRWHRLLGPWPLLLIGAHGILITLGYAAQDGQGAPSEFFDLLTTYPGVLAATAGFGLLAMAGVTSYRKVRRRMAHETWWAVHLYTYLGLAISFSHQLATGASFVGHPVARAWWIGLWLGSAGIVLAYRVGLPVLRSLRHALRVESVERVAPGCVTVICRGRSLDRLPFRGGQFLQWRFLQRGLWWQAHPYSASAMPDRSRIRLTVKDLGDHGAALARIRPGTRVAFEGPYGVFTDDVRQTERVLLVGGGVGAAPLLALLEDQPAGVDPVVILRGSTADDLVLHAEFAELVSRRGGELHELVGPRQEVAIDAAAILRLVPDLRERDVYICGPTGFADSVAASARLAGVPQAHIHREEFEL
jgi:predicted ferric reductase